MKYFIIDETMTTELVSRFIDFVNSQQGEKITIYLDSIGGFSVSAQIFCDIINQSPDNFVLVAANSIRSAAFWLFFSVSCHRQILEGTTGICHISGNTVRVGSNGRIPDAIQRFESEDLALGLSGDIEFHKMLGFTESEMETFTSGGDVFLGQNRLTEMLSVSVENLINGI